MRITNKVMQNNVLTNINRNKEMQDSLTTQLATGKKINKPSEDPVTAIRALRLRSDVNQVTQYSKKNVPDANSWMELTESSINTSISVIKDMIEKCEKGSNDTLTTSDRKIIIDSLKELRNEIYATGNSDYAGRFIFTGYRTDTPLTFTENATEKYTIYEQLGNDSVEQMTYISTTSDGSGNKLLDISEASFDGGNQMAEQDITSVNYYRMRLSYDNASDTNFTCSLKDDKFEDVVDADNNPVSFTTTTMENAEEAYKEISNATDDKVIFVPSTGEVLISESAYNKIKESNAQLVFGYEKENWKKGDLRPEHYFACKTTDDSVTPAKEVLYNMQDEDANGKIDTFERGLMDQGIEYQVGFNQNIRVNTMANEVYFHAVGRDVDEIVDLANYLTEVESMKDKLGGMLKDTDKYSDAEIENIQKDFDAADKATTLLRDQLQKTFSKYITNMQGYLDGMNSALTTVGNRSARLELISNRLDDQTTTFKTLQSENEDADATEVAVQLSSAKVSYQAALMATSDMIQETLLNYL